MKCPICKYGDTVNGPASMVLERDSATLVFKNVPAQVCTNCGEEFFSNEVTRSILDQAESAISAGVEIDVRQYRTA